VNFIFGEMPNKYLRLCFPTPVHFRPLQEMVRIAFVVLTLMWLNAFEQP